MHPLHIDPTPALRAIDAYRRALVTGRVSMFQTPGDVEAVWVRRVTGGVVVEPTMGLLHLVGGPDVVDGIGREVVG